MHMYRLNSSPRRGSVADRVFFALYNVHVDAVTDVPVIHVKYPEDCCPTGWRFKYACWEAALRTGAGQRWWTLRCFANKLVDHKWFETFIIIMIIGSSISLVSPIISLFQQLHQTFSDVFIKCQSKSYCTVLCTEILE